MLPRNNPSSLNFVSFIISAVSGNNLIERVLIKLSTMSKNFVSFPLKFLTPCKCFLVYKDAGMNTGVAESSERLFYMSNLLDDYKEHGFIEHLSSGRRAQATDPSLICKSRVNNSTNNNKSKLKVCRSISWIRIGGRKGGSCYFAAHHENFQQNLTVKISIWEK